jgi:hypothetical protein
VANVNELTAQLACESFALGEEAGVVNAPHKNHFVCELSGCEGGVKSAPFRLVVARSSQGLVVWWRGVMMEAKLCVSCI